MKKIFLKDWLFYVIAWIVITVFYSFFFLNNMRVMVKFLGIEQYFISNDLSRYFISNYQYVESILFGLFFGTATFFVNILVEHTNIHKLTYGKIILVKTILYFIAIIIVFLLIALLLELLDIIPSNVTQIFDPDSVPLIFWFSAAIFFILSTMQINFLVLMNKKFGPGNLLKIFMGKYHQPVVENRLFLFLDLKDSTAIAEKLGHIKYSQLLQDCFLELNRLVMNEDAEIYQYVGDEAVLTWKFNREDVILKPVQLFFAYQKKLEKKAGFYEMMFGLVPEFKAGLHGGSVTVAEVGDIKREIAYHGDVVNTTSRLRSACNEFHKKFLASELINKKLIRDQGFSIDEIGKIHLKGKSREVKVFSIELL